jgi:hypothetical protein
MKNVFTYGAKPKAKTLGSRVKAAGRKAKASWNNNKGAVGTTVRSTLVVAVGTTIGLAASKMLGRK